jgi:large subunit ribosomal protein L10
LTFPAPYYWWQGISFGRGKLPTQAKIDRVKELQEKLERCSIVVTTNYTGIAVNDMTDLRRRLRDVGVEFVVVKNTLIHLAADAAQQPQVKDIIQGPTAIALGYDEPADVAKSINDYIRATRSPLSIQGAVLSGGASLQATDVERLASLPPRPQLVAMLLGQMQAPVQRFASVLNAPLQNLGGLLQARLRQLEAGEDVA